MVALPTDIQQIGQMQDGVLRNLTITQRYHDLSLALSETIGGDDVNWSTFATWASKTAGQSIRNEEVPPFVAEVVGDAGDDVMHPLGKIESAIHAVVPTSGFHPSFLLAPIAETLTTVSTSIAAGNLKVFAELSPQFVRFVQAFRGNPPTDAQLSTWIEPLDPRPAAEGGQLALRQAFTAYVAAIRASDATARARLMLLGNCMIGLHEQTRLQPQIQEAMDAPIDDILKKHLHASLRTGAAGLFDRLVAAVEAPLAHLVDVVEDVWERIATRFLMSLALPGGAALPLGRNIPKDAAARDYLPAALQNVVDPTELLGLLKQYDRARGASDVGSASVDWRLLDDRMNFIVNLFRSRQKDAELLEQPFSDAQRAEIEAGRIPGAALGKL
ncbi:MAG TPA: hypothetical protein VIF15_11250 [Polyangiaceae bacterium]|jgi:hypothetical protein